MTEELDKIEELHEKFKKFTTEELCEILVQVNIAKPNPKLVRIIKTYIARSLDKEGIA